MMNEDHNDENNMEMSSFKNFKLLKQTIISPITYTTHLVTDEAFYDNEKRDCEFTRTTSLLMEEI